MNTRNCGLDDAEVCRRNGWPAGTWLVGRECGRLDLIEITAVGRENVFAVWWPEGGESHTSLDCRDWRVATEAERAALGPEQPEVNSEGRESGNQPEGRG